MDNLHHLTRHGSSHPAGLLPEMEIDLEKVLLHCEEVMSSKGYAVIVARDPQWEIQGISYVL